MALLDYRRWYKTNAASVAQWDESAETYNTPVAIPNLQGIKITPVMDTDEARSYGVLEDGLAVIVGYEIELDFTGKDDASAQEMTGQTSTSSGSGASEQRTTRSTGGDLLPYFGMAVQILAQDGGDLHLHIPKAQLQSLMPMELAAENKFVMPNVTAKAFRKRLADDTLFPIIDEIEHATATSLSTDFDTDFTSL